LSFQKAPHKVAPPSRSPTNRSEAVENSRNPVAIAEAVRGWALCSGSRGWASDFLCVLCGTCFAFFAVKVFVLYKSGKTKKPCPIHLPNRELNKSSKSCLFLSVENPASTPHQARHC
jgi:hypothetical protein